MHRWNAAALGTVLLIAGLHLTTLRPGHEWGDDFSLYVAHARNLAEGRDYADTGYVYNPHFPSLSPRTYPPVFPLLLAPVYRVFGLDLQAMKAFVVLLFGAFLWVLWLALRRHLPPGHALAGLALVGLNPYVWQHKDRLLSEVPFLLFAYLALLLAERAHDPGRRQLWAWGLLAGLVAYLAFGTRTVGLVLIPSLLAWDLLYRRRVGLVSLSAAGAFAAGVAVQKFLLPPDASYLDQTVFNPLLHLRVALSLVKGMGLFLENGHSGTLRVALSLCLLALALAGFASRLRRGFSVYEPFAVFSFLLLALWPYAEWNIRYLLPVLPLFFLYVCEGLHGLTAAPALRRLERPAAVTLAVLVLASYAGRYTRVETGPVRAGVTAPETLALFDHVRSRTRPDDVFLFGKPRALALFTGRRASGVHVPRSDEQLWQYLGQAGVTHLVICRQFRRSQKVLEPFVERHAERFERVYVDGVFTVYRLREGRLARR